jgi:diguanylate cyclase (GGDEF)-like protein
MSILPKSLKFRYMLVIASVIVVTALVSIFNAFETIQELSDFYIKTFENSLFDDKRNELRSAIQIAEDTIQTFYQISLKEIVQKEIKQTLKYNSELLIKIIKAYYEEHKDKVPLGVLKKEILRMIRHANYGNSGYFFVLTRRGVLLEHPYHPELVGKNVLNLKDVEGHYFIKKFLELASKKGEGFVQYLWPQPGKSAPEVKLTYITVFKPFNWIIGTGLYPSQYYQELEDRVKKQALNLLKNIRYGRNGIGYFWVMDETGRILMHPIWPELVNKKNKVTQMILQELGGRNSAFVIYKWPKPGEKEPKLKISYVVRFEPWDWIIGTGMYVEDIKSNILILEEKTRRHIQGWIIKSSIISLLIAFLTLIILKRFSERNIFKRLKLLEYRLEDIARGQLTLVSTSPGEDEIGKIEEDINKVAQAFKQIHEELNRVIHALREGHEVSLNLEGLQGEYRTILESLFTFYQELFTAFNLIEKFALSLESGNLEDANSNRMYALPPVFLKIVKRLELAKKNLLNILEEIKEILLKIEEGEFDIEVKTSASGVYGEIIQDLGQILNNFKKILKQIELTSMEVLKGNLNVRIPETDFKGGYKRIAHYLNQIISQLKMHIQSVERLLQKERELLELRELVEEDSTVEESLNRISQILERKFGIKRYAFYEVNSELIKILLPHSGQNRFCKKEVYGSPELCRANRLKKTIIGRSKSWGGECEYFNYELGNYYLCIPFLFEEETRYVLQILTESEEELNSLLGQVKEIKTYLNTILPIVEVKKLLKTLEERSVKDGLTGLYNRHFLNEYILKSSEFSLRYGHTLGILMIDIDFFKKVNDEFGHDVGDKVLKQIADILSSRFRKTDVIVRYGGEEFLVVLHNIEEKKLMQIAEDIRKEVEKASFKTPQGEIKKTISIGVAIFPEDSKDIWEVIKFADIALYHAKKTGRNRVVRFTRALIQTEL